MTDNFRDLDWIKNQAESMILQHQKSLSGLLPSGDSNDKDGAESAWVRDNLYSATAVWALWKATSRQGDTASMEKYSWSVRAIMRGLLQRIARQSDRIEKFKKSLKSTDALYAKYPLVGVGEFAEDDEWGHLQLDATSLYLLYLAQMTRSGLEIIDNEREVHLVQNLVHYISKGALVADYGIWERGHKMNIGRPELHSSSVGMIRSALKAISNLELMPGACPIKINEDDLAYCAEILDRQLPRESQSKAVDSALLTISGFPAFAIENDALLKQTEDEIDEKLEGNYGYKRFLLDGYQSPQEDKSRLYYDSNDLNNFNNVESEWPLFWCYKYITACYRHNLAEAAQLRQKIESVVLPTNGVFFIPELYRVSEKQVAAEKAAPGSQTRLPGKSGSLLWAESLYLTGCLLEGGWIQPDDLDPYGLHRRAIHHDTVELSLLMVCDKPETAEQLERIGIKSYMTHQLGDLKVLSSSEYLLIGSHLGADAGLGLSGLKDRLPGSMETAHKFSVNGENAVFLPAFQNQTRFYLASDNRWLVGKFKSEWSYLQRHWRHQEQPVMVCFIAEDMLNAEHSAELLQLFQDTKSSEKKFSFATPEDVLLNCRNVRLPDVPDLIWPEGILPRRLNRQFILPFNAAVSHPLKPTFWSLLDPDQGSETLESTLVNSENIYEQLDALIKLYVSFGSGYQLDTLPDITLEALAEELYQRARVHGYWGISRKIAAIMGKFSEELEQAVATLLLNQHQLVLGRAYNDVGLVQTPLSSNAVMKLLKKNTGYDEREALLNQELILHLAQLVRQYPDLLRNVISLRTGQLMQLILTSVSEHLQDEAEAFDKVCQLPPSEIRDRLYLTLVNGARGQQQQFNREALHVDTSVEVKLPMNFDVSMEGVADWHQWREEQGVVLHMSESFYTNLWQLMESCLGLIIGNRFEAQTRLDSDRVLSEMTPGEDQFPMLFEVMLNRITSSSYRAMTLEAIDALISFNLANPEVRINNYLVIEVILGHAVRIHWLENHDDSDQDYNQNRGDAWRAFYHLSPDDVRQQVMKAIGFLLETGISASTDLQEAEVVYLP